MARSVDVTDRPLENGDKAELDYAGTVMAWRLPAAPPSIRRW